MTLQSLVVSRAKYGRIWLKSAGVDYPRHAGIRPDSRVSDAIETVIECRHQNRRWLLKLLHPEHIPLEMETGVGRVSRRNTLRALRVLH